MSYTAEPSALLIPTLQKLLTAKPERTPGDFFLSFPAKNKGKTSGTVSEVSRGGLVITTQHMNTLLCANLWYVQYWCPAID